MKRLAILLLGVMPVTVCSQSFPIKNANREYVAREFTGYDLSNEIPHRILRDHEGLYWFQDATGIRSFDGINWKQYKVRSATGKEALIRMNDMVITEDGEPWLATSDGIYVFDKPGNNFIPIQFRYPEAVGYPLAANCFAKGLPGTLFFNSLLQPGFFFVEWKTKKIHHIIIDSTDNKALVPSGDILFPLTVDSRGNAWGFTERNNGIWHFNIQTRKLQRSWKGELPLFAGSRFRDLTGILYNQKENALWITHTSKLYLEKVFLQSGKSVFYSFNGNLQVSSDTSNPGRYRVVGIKNDKKGNAWVRVAGKYLIRLDPDMSRMEYLVEETDVFPIHDFFKFDTEKSVGQDDAKDRNKILLWVVGKDRIWSFRKAESSVRHLIIDTSLYKEISMPELENIDGRKNLYLANAHDNGYLILQSLPDRPKMVWLDQQFRIVHALFNDEWKRYPAYFNRDFNRDSLYIAFMRPDIEPLDFRNVIIKEFRIDLRARQKKEVKSDFKQAICRYGTVDNRKVYWLFSAGTLFSYSPEKDQLDSIFICKPNEKGPFRIKTLKYFDYPAILHKESNTFWIVFPSTKELYKIDLRLRKIARIFKCCTHRTDCDISASVFGVQPFDQDNICLYHGFTTSFLNVRDDSVSGISELLKNDLQRMAPIGAFQTADWIYYVLPTRIFFLNKRNGNLRAVRMKDDFNWRISPLSSTPLINDRGELVVMCSRNNGFLVLDIDSVLASEKPGTVEITSITVDEQDVPLDSIIGKGGLTLRYRGYHSLQFNFSDFSIFDPAKTNYQYSLYEESGDTIWNVITGSPRLAFSKLSPGRYKLLLRASNAVGEFSPQIIPLHLTIRPPFVQTIWFMLVLAAGLALILFGFYRYRMKQVLHLQAIRNNIASDLHDDIGSTLNSISIYSEVAKQQAGKEIPALDLIGANSRKIVESMSDIVWTINPENDSFEKVIARMRSFAHQLLKAKKVEYTFEVDEKMEFISLPMQVRKNFYLVFKESVTNLIKYSGATRVAISLSLQKNKIFLNIRDNGVGIPDNPETQGNGMMNMKRRAREINANLYIHSQTNQGTGIELTLEI